MSRLGHFFEDRFCPKLAKWHQKLALPGVASTEIFGSPTTYPKLPWKDLWIFRFSWKQLGPLFWHTVLISVMILSCFDLWFRCLSILKFFNPPKKMTSKFYMQDIIMFFDSWQVFHPNFWEKKCLVSMWKNQNSYIVSTYRPWWWFLTGSTFFPQIFGEKCDPKWWLQNRYVVPTCRT